jgi:outer membrane protein OmpA-like peptidoglycan-associated protein
VLGIVVTPGAAGLTYRLSTPASSQPLSYRWTINGRQVATTREFSYTFPTLRREYHITLTATNSAGLTSTKTMTFTPRAKASVARLTVQFALDHATLSRDGRRALIRLRGRFAHATRIQITGYCAASHLSRSAWLVSLSNQRARMLLRVLSAHANHHTGTLKITKAAATHFIAADRDAQNRRATITIHYLRPLR